MPRLSAEIRQYLLVTGNYWAFTLTDGALRMLVVLHFHQLGYTPLQVALLFLFYEAFGVVTNLFGGWLGARIGLNHTMNLGLGLRVVALGMLTPPASWLTVPWVMGAQALSGIAKDLNKMSAKSSIKRLVPADQHGTLFRWVAALTGSRTRSRARASFSAEPCSPRWDSAMPLALLAASLASVWIFSLACLQRDLGKASNKPRFRDLFSKARLSTRCRRHACSCSVRATSGSSLRCRCTSPPPCTGTRQVSAHSSPAGSSSTASCR
ncbi:hypothetical protein PEC18_30255 [Paucibacter sp. O1-1]|nr:hypothetical protein [Paucibacter sp. O1-1]MDA3830002.1 hypothetical protein [Paucibacter sp. O1-1]